MSLLKSSIATSAALMLAAVLAVAPACAAGPRLATITHVDGIVLAKTAAGKAKVLSGGSAVEVGDTLLTDAHTHARLRFADGNDLTLGPATQLVIAAPASYVLVKGALRGSGRFALKADEADLEVQGAFVIELVAEPAKAAFRPLRLAALDTGTMTDAPTDLAQNAPPGGGGLAAGLYVHVIDGIINLSNKGGSQSFSAGQFGYTASFVKPPVVVPANPGIQFSPPPSFSSVSGTKPNSSGSGKAATVDCEVR